jgi:hypothetical protein
MATETVRDKNFYALTGYNAYRLGLTAADCPYKAIGDIRRTCWMTGYNYAVEKKATPMAVERRNSPNPHYGAQTGRYQSTRPNVKQVSKYRAATA